MLTFILGASLTFNLALIFLANGQANELEAAQEIIEGLMTADQEEDDDAA